MTDHLPTFDPNARAREVGGDRARRLWEDWTAGLSPNTRAGYLRDLRAFRAFVGAPDDLACLRDLLEGGMAHANARALAWKQDLLRRGLAAQTVNRRLAALASLVRLGRTLGLVAWALSVRGVRREPRRDMRGPSLADVRRLFGLAASDVSPTYAARNVAILHALYVLALRRSEVAALDLADYASAEGVLRAPAKGRRERGRVGLPPETRAALDRWLAFRGSAPGPLFPGIARRPGGACRITEARLATSTIWRLVARLGRRIGIAARPHGLRHRAITEALNATGGNLRAVCAFSRHSGIAMLAAYDDDRLDRGAKVANLVAGSLESPPPT